MFSAKRGSLRILSGSVVAGGLTKSQFHLSQKIGIEVNRSAMESRASSFIFKIRKIISSIGGGGLGILLGGGAHGGYRGVESSPFNLF